MVIKTGTPRRAPFSLRQEDSTGNRDWSRYTEVGPHPGPSTFFFFFFLNKDLAGIERQVQPALSQLERLASSTRSSSSMAPGATYVTFEITSDPT